MGYQYGTSRVAHRLARGQTIREAGAHDSRERRHQDAFAKAEFGNELLL